MKINFKYIGDFDAPKIQTSGAAGLDLFKINLHILITPLNYFTTFIS